MLCQNTPPQPLQVAHDVLQCGQPPSCVQINSWILTIPSVNGLGMVTTETLEISGAVASGELICYAVVMIQSPHIEHYSYVESYSSFSL